MSVADRYGPYELVRRLGSGGMAETFLAVRRGPGGFVQHVCVKRILPALEADPDFVAQFLEEARLAAQLRHGAITQVVDFGEVEGSHYLALELVDGMDLRGLLAKLREKGTRLPVPLATHIGLRLAGALHFAHTPGARRPAVIHRDISPSNVLLSRAGGVYLTDFGIARSLGHGGRTESGVVRGKVPYMAAEYARTGRYGPATDLFALGVVLFEALAGQRPFDGQTDLDTLQRIQEGRRERLSTLAPETPPALLVVVERLLAPEPDDRFDSAAAVLEALATVAPPPTVEGVLGQLVCDSSESLSASLRLPPTDATDGRARTAAAAVPPAPALPEVRSAPPDAHTWTADALAQTTREPSGTEALWSATDPGRVSHHDRVAPVIPSAGLASTLPMQDVSPSLESPSSPSQPSASGPSGPSASSPSRPSASSPSRPSASSPSRPALKGRGAMAGIVFLGVLVFVLATAGTYALVGAFSAGP